MKRSIVFFGSFQAYSVSVLKALLENFNVTAVVTTPPKPAGRHMEKNPTEVSLYAKRYGLPLFELESLGSIPKAIGKPDFIVVAGFGMKIPEVWLSFPTVMAVNMHPSLLPQYRGAFPAEWAILKDEKETGVTLLQMTDAFDQGPILVQTHVNIAPTDTKETLYKKLFDRGGMILVKSLPAIADGRIKPQPQLAGSYFYAKRLTREDGYIPWEKFKKGLEEDPQALDRKLRALAPWPGVWTTMPDGKRLKLISTRPKMLVQPEGKTPTPYSQIVKEG